MTLLSASTLSLSSSHRRLPPLPGAWKGPAAWGRVLEPAVRLEWLVDCYRVRLNDVSFHGEQYARGLYDPEHTVASIVQDFLLFVKLALRRGIIPTPTPPDWSWSAFLSKASELLRFPFEESEAQAKYGGDDALEAARVTGELVYKVPVKARITDDENEALLNSLRRVWPSFFTSSAGEMVASNAPGVFEDAGGWALWEELFDALSSSRPGEYDDYDPNDDDDDN